jgi:D-glycero-alpha-D-manno-heptose-7-phosphate kinase
MVTLTFALRDELQRGHLDGFGAILHENWMLKKELAREISNRSLDLWYRNACQAVAEGGKVLGAGAGGFLLFYAPPERHPAIVAALDGLRQIDFRFEPGGSRIILCQPQPGQP